MAKAWCRGQGDIRHLPPHGKAMLVGGEVVVVPKERLTGQELCVVQVGKDYQTTAIYAVSGSS